ncbi:PREDICTED: nuclear valosin-containing protein-like [Priapulus caudatus]|uniref:Nuclear valosin-containing protein-like n=1 Tax=Priapulus caudatus TaxID=37621 RepID=A0ABM1EEC6_PRICU|nr:PREDICTED: nuclear valosin-containing protein-like [Priapulus caudatus]
MKRKNLSGQQGKPDHSSKKSNRCRERNNISDPKLIPRVKQYLEAHRTLKMIDITLMSQELQKMYSDYRRKKRNAFEKAVKNVYDLLCSTGEYRGIAHLEKQYLERKEKTHGVASSVASSVPHSNNASRDHSDITSGSESDAEGSPDPDVELVTYEDTNMMNKSITSLYQEKLQPSSLGPSTSSARQASDVDISAGFFIDTAGTRRRGDWTQRGATQEISVETRFGKQSGEQQKKSNTKKPDEEDEPQKKPKRRKLRADDEDEAKEKVATDIVQKSSVVFADVGGNGKTLEEVCKLLIHMKHPEVFDQLGVTPPRGILLHGPPGCGKTLLAHAIAGELDLPFIKVAATEMVSGVSGESEERLREIFEKAVNSAPCILFLDEIDAITPKRETASKEMERRIVSQLLACMDDLNNKSMVQVLILGATNRPDSLDPALRRAGRFDREVCMGIPDEDARISILQVLCKKLRLGAEFDFRHLARNTPGFVGADLMALSREAASHAVDRVFSKLEAEARDNERADKMADKMAEDAHAVETIPRKDANAVTPAAADIQSHGDDANAPTETADARGGAEGGEDVEMKTLSDAERTEVKPDQRVKPMEEASSAGLQSVLKWLREQPPLTAEQLESISITMDDFKVALKTVQPSAKREGFATIPDKTWDDVGALSDIRAELSMAILAPVRHPEQFAALGLTSAPGVLLIGPPGCGKTLLAKAIANESGINFISVKGPELLNMYVGESERAVRQCFQRARNSAPCVIFFDELDSLCPRRSDQSDSGSAIRVVNQLLTEMDGLEARKQVYIMGATNRPDIIDPAILRPGRLDKILYVGLPGPEDRVDILKTITKNGTLPPLADDVNLEEIAGGASADGFTGADLSSLVREASMFALKEFIGDQPEGATAAITSSAENVRVTKQHFSLSFSKVKPSVSTKDQLKYEMMRAMAQDNLG